MTRRGAFFLDKPNSQLKAREGELVEKLKEAQNARYAKEGEVSILRASMSKVRRRSVAAGVGFTSTRSLHKTTKRSSRGCRPQKRRRRRRNCNSCRSRKTRLKG